MQISCETLNGKAITLGVESSNTIIPPDQQPAAASAKEHEVEMADEDDWMDDVVAITVPTLPQVGAALSSAASLQPYPSLLLRLPPPRPGPLPLLQPLSLLAAVLLQRETRQLEPSLLVYASLSPALCLHARSPSAA